MAEKRLQLISLIVCAGALVCSCSIERFLPEGSSALVRNKIEVEGDEVKSGELAPYLRQQQGQRKMLWVKKDNVVVFNPDLVPASERNIKSHLEYLGYFNSGVTSEITTKNRKSTVRYFVRPGNRIRIKEVHYSVPDYGTFAADFYADTVNTTVRPGTFLSESALENETDRFSAYMRTRGYYGFSKNHYFAEADTLSYPGEAVLALSVHGYTRNEPQENEKEIRKFHIGDVSITHDAQLPFRDRILRELNTVKPGSLYNEAEIKNTYNRFSSLKVFNSVGVEMNPVSDSIVDCHINLSESQIKGIKVNLEASTNSSGLVGISPMVTYRNKNIFHGGEWLNLSFMGNFQFKFNEDVKSNEFGISAGLSLPEFLGLPYSHFKGSNIPRTEINLAYNYQNRPEYTRNIASASFGYTGVKGKHFSYKFSPVNANFVRLFNIDPEFIRIMEQNPFMKYAYQDHLDAGGGGSIYWSSTLDLNPRGSYRYLRYNMDFAGNIFSIFNNAMKCNEAGDRLILGVPYAQYIRGELTLGKTWRFGNNDNQAVAVRILGGAGYAYGNSSALPFEKQFYCGGANSMRGWQSRSLGPGHAPKRYDFAIPSQTGDIKFETNVEYRFKMFWKLEGALFADLGNVWTIDRPGLDPWGVFKFSEFLTSLGADWGVGLRCDLNFIIVRIDYGMQVYNPIYEGEFVYPGDWFNGASAFHFGVGYPF